MTDDPLPPPTLPEIEAALDLAVSALVAYRMDRSAFQRPNYQPPAPRGSSALFMISGGQLLATDREVLRARDLVGSPIENGLKRTIHDLGKLVHALVGDDGMIEVAERVCGLDDANWSRRMSPVDSAWSGIGSWVS